MQKGSDINIFTTDIKPFVTSPSSISVTEGSVATLECLTGESAPPPEIRWEKDGLPVKTGTQYSARFGTHPFMIGQYYMQLVLDSKPKETGSYSCVAVNPTLGLEVRSIVVQVTVTGKKGTELGNFGLAYYFEIFYNFYW